jgi:DNA-binding MarR family transcriptional regulator
VADVFRVLLNAGERRLELTAEDIAARLSVEASGSAVSTALAVLDGASLVRRGRRDENLAHVTVHRAESDLFAITPLPPGLGRLLATLVETFGVDQRRAVNLAQVAQRRHVTEETLRRGLQRLHDLARVTYEPPFRGRATEVRVEGVPEDLLAAVDFEALEEKRRREEAKLDQIVAYAHVRGCRRGYLLGCFGVRGVTSCERCDRCLAERARPAGERVHSRRHDGMLRAVVGAVAAHDGRFGFRKLADHLIGSRSAAIASSPLSRGATYGALSGQKRAVAELWLHQAHEQGLLALKPHTMPDGRRVHLVEVTPEGRSLLKDAK